METLEIVGMHSYPYYAGCCTSLPVVKENNTYHFLYPSNRKDHIWLFSDEDVCLSKCEPFIIEKQPNLLAIWVDFSILEQITEVPQNWHDFQHKSYKDYKMNCLPQDQCYALMNGWARLILEKKDISRDLVNFGFGASDKDIRWQFHLLRSKLPTTKLSVKLQWELIVKYDCKDKTYEDFLNALGEN